ncbi:MAG: hypothetical protein P9M07_03060 [Candidatus Aceula meridiana]|nr:hypothetical protein [Candidatus Aceula meridiana]
MMKLFHKFYEKYVDFGSVFVASGTRNTHGQGWRHHRAYKFIPGFTFEGTTLITKTFTATERMDSENAKGNLKLNRKTLMPIHLFPDCVKSNLWKEETYNSVGLSGLAFKEIFERGELQGLKKPFIISFMAVGKTIEERLKEYRDFVKVIWGNIWKFGALFAIEINVSCPNTCHDPGALIKEVIKYFNILKRLGVPLGIKFNILASHETVKAIMDSGLCDFIDIPNTFPITLENIWKYPKALSIYNKYGSCGFSSPSQFLEAASWVQRAREIGIKEHIILGSIYCKEHVEVAKDIGTDAISVGAVSIVRPHRLNGIIKKGHVVFG